MDALLAFAAALVALLALPVRLEISGSILFAAGLVVIMRQDYRARPALKLPAPRPNPWRAIFRAPALGNEQHRLAA